MHSERTTAARNRARTELRIQKAVEQLLVRQGFPGLGINAIARAARVDKVLIYRYFGDIEGLLRAVAGNRPLWPSHEDILKRVRLPAGSRNSGALTTARLAAIAEAELDLLTEDPLMLAVLAWSLSKSSPLTRAQLAARDRERRMLFRNPAVGTRPQGRGAPKNGQSPAPYKTVADGLILEILQARAARRAFPAPRARTIAKLIETMSGR
ncbi:MAG: TetR/AcrR family transcriptional regulator [Spirochaetales bacterium]|nr:TetR/AcrR family transcriptional regulator [Leptospiraceae bacterium]MCP5483012.1 TetR/AcrR family transcriptional regulator [Spirochaetales bacterium]MCP5486182.1 TetR/AcrR family transcriptional regulator [Spirochaetales bacterium]